MVPRQDGFKLNVDAVGNNKSVVVGLDLLVKDSQAKVWLCELVCVG